MERRTIDFWLPSINKLKKTIELTVKTIQKTNDRSNIKKISNNFIGLLTFDEAIKKRKDDLKYLKGLLTKCQNSMKINLEMSQVEILSKINYLDQQIDKYEKFQRIRYNFDQNCDENNFDKAEQALYIKKNRYSNNNRFVNSLMNKIEYYENNIPNISKKIVATEDNLKQMEAYENERKCQLLNAQLLKGQIQRYKQKMKELEIKKKQIYHQKINNLPKNTEIFKMQTFLKNSIASLRSQITTIDREINDINSQKSEVRSLIKMSQSQYMDMKKCIADITTKTTQKFTFRTNVIEEMKKLVHLRKDKTDLDKVLKVEKLKVCELKDDIGELKSKISSLKKQKKKLNHKEIEIEHKFFHKISSMNNKSENLKKIKFNLQNMEDESDESGSEIDQKEIHQKKELVRQDKKNLKLLKKVEKYNSENLSIKQAIRDTQEHILFQTKLKNEKERAKKERENQSILFSFEKIQNQIKEKQENIANLKKQISEKKEFLKKNEHFVEQKPPQPRYNKILYYFNDFYQRIRLEKKRWISNLHVSSIQLLCESWNSHINELEAGLNEIDF